MSIKMDGVNYGSNIVNGNLSIINGVAYLNGQKIQPEDPNVKYQKLEIVIQNDSSINTVKSEGCSVEIHGNVAGNAEAGNSLTCGNIGGNAHAGNSINAKDIYGSCNAGISINAQRVKM